MNLETLIEAGLSPEQAEIYTSLLENGPQTAIGLARSTTVKRTYVYRICQELAKLNLANTQTKANTTYFAPLSPHILLSHIEAKKAQTEAALHAIQGTLPQLESMFRLIDTKPVITYFEGVEGIKKVYLDTLTSHTDILALVQTSQVDPDIYSWVTNFYAKERVAHQINVKAIVATGSKTSSYERLNQKELRETKTINYDKYPIEHEINLYDNKLAIINHKKGQPLLGIIIDNSTIATTFRSWFLLTWAMLK